MEGRSELGRKSCGGNRGEEEGGKRSLLLLAFFFFGFVLFCFLLFKFFLGFTWFAFDLPPVEKEEVGFFFLKFLGIDFRIVFYCPDLDLVSHLIFNKIKFYL